MIILDPGHLYRLNELDGGIGVELRFVKRVGDKYPGNAAPPYSGTTTQEVLRALINRTKYVNNQKRWTENEWVLDGLRLALLALERRAASARDAERGNTVATDSVLSLPAGLEVAPVCLSCGHTFCREDCHKGPA